MEQENNIQETLANNYNYSNKNMQKTFLEKYYFNEEHSVHKKTTIWGISAIIAFLVLLFIIGSFSKGSMLPVNPQQSINVIEKSI